MKTRKERIQEETKVNAFVKDLRKLLSKYSAEIISTDADDDAHPITIYFRDKSSELITKGNCLYEEVVFNTTWFEDEFEQE